MDFQSEQKQVLAGLIKPVLFAALLSSPLISTSTFAHNEAKHTTIGGYRDLLASSFKIDDSYYIPPKVESPQFRFTETDWKRPM